MKKLITLLSLFVMIIVSVAVASTWYSRSTVALGVTTGAGTYTNTTSYSALQLTRIWVYNALAADNTVTVTRVTSDSPITTQAVGSITVAANAGNTASFTAGYLKYGDKLVFASTAGTGATAMVEYQIQQP